MNHEITSKTVLWRMVFSTLATCVTSVCAGMTLGVTAVLLPQLKQDKQLLYDGSLDSWIASIANLTMILGSIIAGFFLDRYGRKLALILIGIPFIIGWVCIASAKTTLYILMGRLITGMSSGAQFPVIIVYVGEIVDPKFRTMALTVNVTMLHIGVLLSHLIGSYFNWRVCAIISIFPPLLASINFMFVKESPLWLISKRRTEEGVKSFYWFRGTGEAAEAELAAVLQRSEDVKGYTFRDGLRTVCKLSFLKPFMIAVFLVANIQCVGIVVFYYYANYVFEGTFAGQVDSFTMMIATDCIRAVSAFLVSILATIFPKKITFIVLNFGIAMSLYILVAYLLVLEHGYVWVPITCVVIYICLTGPLSPIGMSIVPEVMPNNTRGLGSGVTTSTSFLLQFTVVKITPDIINNYGIVTLYGIMATFSLIFGILFVFILPETGGKTLQSIEDSFNKNSKNDESTCTD